MLLHPLGHVLIHMGIGPCYLAKLPLDLYISPEGYEVRCLLMTPVGPPVSVWQWLWGLTWWQLAGALAVQPQAPGSDIQGQVPAVVGQAWVGRGLGSTAPGSSSERWVLEELPMP